MESRSGVAWRPTSSVRREECAPPSTRSLTHRPRLYRSPRGVGGGCLVVAAMARRATSAVTKRRPTRAMAVVSRCRSTRWWRSRSMSPCVASPTPAAAHDRARRRWPHARVRRVGFTAARSLQRGAERTRVAIARLQTRRRRRRCVAGETSVIVRVAVATDEACGEDETRKGRRDRDDPSGGVHAEPQAIAQLHWGLHQQQQAASRSRT